MSNKSGMTKKVTRGKEECMGLRELSTIVSPCLSPLLLLLAGVVGCQTRPWVGVGVTEAALVLLVNVCVEVL